MQRDASRALAGALAGGVVALGIAVSGCTPEAPPPEETRMSALEAIGAHAAADSVRFEAAYPIGWCYFTAGRGEPGVAHIAGEIDSVRTLWDAGRVLATGEEAVEVLLPTLVMPGGVVEAYHFTIERQRGHRQRVPVEIAGVHIWVDVVENLGTGVVAVLGLSDVP